MKKILATGPFEGEIVLVYGEPGVGAAAYPPLLLVDFKGVQLSDDRKLRILYTVPVRYDGNFGSAWGNAPLKFVEEDEEVDFETDFWKPFDNKTNKERAVRAWKATGKGDRILAVHSIAGYNSHLSQNQWKAKMSADRFLREKQYKTDWYSL
jgi:hypothetical protein